MTTYFINCKTLDELKKSYKAAAMGLQDHGANPQQVRQHHFQP